MGRALVLVASSIVASGVASGAGCGAHRSGPCSKSDPCDDGYVCDFTDPDGPSCLDANGDLDGDGLLNGEDFCPRSPGGKYDEDGDGIGDDCDPCPIAPPPAVPDADGDEVDSPCDPDPRTPGDKIVAFSGFHEMPANWTQRTPSAWVIASDEPVEKGGQVLVRSPDANPETLSIPLPFPSNQLAVLTAYRVDQVDGGTFHEIAVAAVDRRPAGGESMLCGGERAGTGDFVVLTTTTATSNKQLTDLFNTASLYEVVGTIDRVSSACALISDRDMAAVQAAISGDTMSEAGLSVQGASVRFGYILVIARQ